MDSEIEKILQQKAELARAAQSAVKPAGYIGEAEPFLVKGAKTLADNTKQVVKGVTDHIGDTGIQKLISGNAFSNKLASILESRAASRLAQKAAEAGGMLTSVGKHLPVIGGLAVGLGTALATGDASAGEQAVIPLMNEADPVGPQKGSPEYNMESGTATPDELDQLRKRFQQPTSV